MITRPGHSSTTKKAADVNPNEKYALKQRERMEKAREEKERIKMMTERGITPNEIQNYPSANTSTGKKVPQRTFNPKEEVKAMPMHSIGSSPDKERKKINNNQFEF